MERTSPGDMFNSYVGLAIRMTISIQCIFEMFNLLNDYI